MGSVLFVCKANVCRSPVMSFVFSAAVRAHAPVEVQSAGTRASEGSPICDISRKVLASRRRGAGFADQHRSMSVSGELIRRQDLIFVASREERAAIALMIPEHRSRVFTVREALALSQEPLSPAEQRSLRQIGLAAPWTMCASLLNLRRGTVNLEPVPGRFPWSRSRDRMDIADAHQRGRHHHAAAIRRVADITEDLGSRMLRLIGEVSVAVG